jgi:gamma-glutamyltranspeptidase/glutathione hydrolase
MTRGMVCAPQPEAVEAGAVALRRGGNAIDAAIACALVQGVVDPLMTGIAGVGTSQVVVPGENLHRCYSFLGHVPAAARPDMWSDRLESENADGYGFRLRGRVNEVGHQSVITPASLAAYHHIAALHGSMDWRDLVAPAIEHAERGRVVRPHVLAYITQEDAHLGRLNNIERLRHGEASRRLFFDASGNLPRLGAVLPNPDLARTLARIAAHGAAEMHGGGETAQRIAADMRANDGLITEADLAASRVATLEPLWCSYRRYRIAAASLPSSGLMVLIMLRILEHFALHELGHNTPEYLRVLAETMKYATQDRLEHFGDPEFVRVPVDDLLAAERAADRAERIRRGERCELVRVGRGEPSSTTHVSTIDEHGNAVTMTHTLGPVSGVVTEGLGFLHNACMAIFDPRPGRPASIAPGRSYQSSIAPVIVFDSDAPCVVVGAPGATHIPLAVLQVLVNVLDFGMDMAQAVSAPRISVTSEAIDVSNRIPRFVTDPLASGGYRIRRSPLSYAFAGVHGIQIRGGRWIGGADPGRDGMALEV